MYSRFTSCPLWTHKQFSAFPPWGTRQKTLKSVTPHAIHKAQTAPPNSFPCVRTSENSIVHMTMNPLLFQIFGTSYYWYQITCDTPHNQLTPNGIPESTENTYLYLQVRAGICLCFSISSAQHMVEDQCWLELVAVAWGESFHISIIELWGPSKPKSASWLVMTLWEALPARDRGRAVYSVEDFTPFGQMSKLSSHSVIVTVLSGRVRACFPSCLPLKRVASC